MEFFFDTREEASVGAAGRIAEALRRRLDAGLDTSLVVSGGTTPARCFTELAGTSLDWSSVTVLASDDRWVPADHDDSNEKLVRETLLVDKAAKAEFFGYYADGKTIEHRCRELDAEVRFMPFPFACSLLGMGADGHFASLFPDADNLDEGLDLESHALCVPVQTAASPHARVSLTLAALSRSDEIVLLFFGDDKRAVYEQCKDNGDQYPVSRLLRQRRAPVHIFWAP